MVRVHVAPAIFLVGNAGRNSISRPSYLYQVAIMGEQNGRRVFMIIDAISMTLQVAELLHLPER